MHLRGRRVNDRARVLAEVLFVGASLDGPTQRALLLVCRRWAYALASVRCVPPVVHHRPGYTQRAGLRHSRKMTSLASTKPSTTYTPICTLPLPPTRPVCRAMLSLASFCART